MTAKLPIITLTSQDKKMMQTHFGLPPKCLKNNFHSSWPFWNHIVLSANDELTIVPTNRVSNINVAFKLPCNRNRGTNRAVLMIMYDLAFNKEMYRTGEMTENPQI